LNAVVIHDFVPASKNLDFKTLVGLSRAVRVRAPILGLDDGPLRGGIGVATEGGGREVTSKACGGLPGVVGDGGESGGLFEAVGD